MDHPQDQEAAVVIHYAHSTDKRTGCGVPFTKLPAHGRFINDLASVDCEACLISDAAAALRMEDALITFIDSGPPAAPKVLNERGTKKHSFTPPHRKRPR